MSVSRYPTSRLIWGHDSHAAGVLCGRSHVQALELDPGNPTVKKELTRTAQKIKGKEKKRYRNILK